MAADEPRPGPTKLGAAASERAGSQPPDPLIGRVINDRFRVVAMIARGGMGKVYRAEQAPLGREVALKVLNPSYAGDGDPEFHKRFFLEASTTAKLTHPHTVSIFDYGRTDDDVYYIAMELLEGKTLHRALRESGPMEPARALHIARQICRSLREAHALGVIHRDLKPANIFLVQHGDESDFVKVLDFGLVKDIEDEGEDLTQTGLFMGSPKYMSPEQIRGERVDGRADVYSLGVILYEMLTAKVPFDRASSVNLLMAHLHDAPPPMRESHPGLAIEPALEQLVLKALAKTPAERFASMDELLSALKQSDGALSEHRALSGDLVPSVSMPIPRPEPSLATTDVPLDESPTRLLDTAPASSAPASRVPRLVLAALAIAALAVLGIVLAMPESAPRATEQGTSPTEASRAPEPATAPEAPTVARTLVSLRSEPAGASVTVISADGTSRTYGPTPADVEWTGADAEQGREVTLRFELAAHRDLSVPRTINGDSLVVSATLEPLANRPRPRQPRRTDERDRPVGPVKGYKLDPY